jgi:hypothetical protein
MDSLVAFGSSKVLTGIFAGAKKSLAGESQPIIKISQFERKKWVRLG